jgi:hypothetical protein
LLSRFTTARERAWFAVWNGYGTPVPLTGEEPPGCAVRQQGGAAPEGRPPARRPATGPSQPILRLPHREYLVFVGPLSDLPSWTLPGPNLWWPDDRAWFVASEIDLVSTYVAGPAAAIKALLHDHLMEVVPSSITDGITAGADRVNL